MLYRARELLKLGTTDGSGGGSIVSPYDGAKIPHRQPVLLHNCTPDHPQAKGGCDMELLRLSAMFGSSTHCMQSSCSPHAGHTSVSHLQVELSARMLFADGFSSSPLRSVFLLFSKCRASIQLTAAHSFSTCYSHDQPLLRYRPSRGLSETIFKR